MSQSIGPDRDDYADDEFGRDRAPRGRRSRVIVDDSYGDNRYDADPYADEAPELPRRDAGRRGATIFDDTDDRLDAPPRGRRTQARASTRAMVPRDSTADRAKFGGSSNIASQRSRSQVWLYAAFASIVWIAGVLGFAAGVLGLPIDDVGAAIARASALPMTMLAMIGALTIAPLSFIWFAAAIAKRASKLQSDIAELRADVALQQGAAGAPAGLEDAVADLEERLNAAIKQMGAADGAHDDVLREAEARAEQVATQIVERATVELRAEVATRAPAAAAAPALDGSDAIARAAEVARGAIGGGGPSPTAAPTSEPEGDRTARINALREALEGRGGGRPERQEARPIGDGAHGFSEDVDEYGEDELEHEFDHDLDDMGSSAPSVEKNGGDAVAGEIDWSKLVRAANFPDSEDDRDTLDALYAVLTDPEAAALLQSAEDALSALADIDLYMEDMQPHHAPAELWRGYIMDGDRRDAIDLGGIRDAHAIEDVVGAIERNPDFGPTVDRFMDRYEAMLERLFGEAPTTKLAVELADTRSGRAYMLLARAAGRFG